MPIRCLIVDDNHLFLRAARVLLDRDGLDVAGIASNGVAALRAVETLRPDVVLVDISLGEESGFALARSIVGDDKSDATVILISTHSEADFGDMIVSSPAAGFIPKPELSASAIQGIVNGGSR
ncbi:MAG: putative response regulator [Actinomycetia bacterium]|nr:putative response regulator [Actinomycetes bacterium]